MSAALEITVAGEELTLFASRAVFWKRRGMLLVADAHFGKAAAFRAGGFPVPRGTTADALSRLDDLIARTGTDLVVFLGDFLHAREGRAPETLRTVAAWRDSHRDVEMLLVRGNHDRHAGDPPAELAIECADVPVEARPFVLAHHPRADDRGYVLAGHLHPAVRVRGPARDSERLACFWFAERVGVLPAFGDFTGTADVEAAANDRVVAIAGDDLMMIRTESPSGGGIRG